MSLPPPPARSRALIVGLGAYDELGQNWRLDGSIVDAQRLREVLHVDFRIPLDRITLFLAPTDPTQLAALGAREFSRDALDKFLEHELAPDPDGGTLLVCWSGHGCWTPHDNVLHLISSDATAGQWRSINFQRLANMLIGAPYAHFSHQVLLVSTCRSTIDAAPNALNLAVAAPDPLRAVRQCQLYACAEGQTARQTAGEGSLLVREVVAGLRQAAAAQPLAPGSAQPAAWPDFVALAVRARDAVLQASGGLQSPAVFATGWDRGTLAGPAGPAAPPLLDSLRQLNWPPERLAQQALRCLGAHSAWPGDHSLADPQGLVAFLDDQPQARGWPPLTEFVHRLLAAGAQSPALQRWLNLHSSAAEQQRLADFRVQQRLGHVLQIWHDAAGHSLKAALFDADNQQLADAWDKDIGLPLEPAGPQAAIGAWVERALATLGAGGAGGDSAAGAGAAGLPLVLELCLPRDWLAQDLDRAAVPVNGRSVVLNQGLAALLRCTDRLKAPDILSTLTLLAPGVLARAVRSSAVVRWAEPGDNRGTLLRGLFKPQDDVPAWIGLRSPADPQSMSQWQICLDGPAPALFWLRPEVPVGGRAAVEEELSHLLRHAAGDLPFQVLPWRLQQIGCDSEQVALLIDDPRRLPPWAAKVGQPLPSPTTPARGPAA